MDGGKVKLDLKPCRNCGRTFVPESLAKHQNVCKNVQKKRKPFDMTQQRATEELSVRDIKKAQKKVKHEKSCKTVQKKRKPFDTSKQRVTDDLSLRQIKAAQKKEVKPPKSLWRAKHQEFINNIRAAKNAQVAMDRGDPLPPPPPPSLNPDYITCPYCSRRFNEKASERHIPFCKEQHQRKDNKRQPTEQERKRAAAKSYQPPKPKGRGDSPGMGGGYGGGYSNSPSGRGGYSSSPATARGGYSTGPPTSRGGYSNTPPARGARTTEMSRGPAPGGMSRGPASGGGMSRGPAAPSGGMSGGYSSRGRVPAGGPSTRGRPSPSSQSTYQVHEEMREDMVDNQTIPQRRISSGHAGIRTTEHGYHGNDNNDLDLNGSSFPHASKFCHECGSKYPVPTAKFCCECGIKRIGSFRTADYTVEDNGFS